METSTKAVALDAGPALDFARTSSAMRSYLRRALLALFACVPCLAVALAMMNVASDRQEDLERRGARVIGVVTEFFYKAKSGSTVRYRYEYLGKSYEGGHLDAIDDYDEGERVIVFVDPTRPDRSTLKNEEPSYGLENLFLNGGFCGFVILGGWSVYALWTWVLRRTVLRSSPWEKVSFDVSKRRFGRVRLNGNDAYGDIRVNRIQRDRLDRLNSDATNLYVARHKQNVVLASYWRNELALGRIRRR